MSDLAQLLGAAWFMLLAGVSAGAIMVQPITPKLPTNLAVLALYVTLAWLVFSRPPAKARATDWLSRTAAFVGTYMAFGLSLFPATDNPTLNAVAAVLVLAGLAMTLFTIGHLGKAFSLVPQARTVVQSGPYRLIRHPLYVAEGVTILGVVLQHLSVGALLVLAVHISVQACRILNEEKLLQRTLPDYGAYALNRWRVIPYVW